MLDRFEAHLRATSGSARTVRAYTADAREFARFLRDRPPTVDAVEQWVASLNHGRCTPQTIKRKIAAVRRWLAFVARHGDEAALRTLTVLRDYRVTPAVRPADVKETKAITCEVFMALRDRSSPRYRALFDLLWWTGARISEIVGDPMTGIPPLSGANMVEMVRGGCIWTLGKGGRRRLLVLPSRGRECLRAFAESLESQRLAFPITARAVNATLHRLGFDGGAHSFRHEYRARLRQAGITEELQRALMGHGPKNVTSGYGSVGIEELMLAVERLSQK